MKIGIAADHRGYKLKKKLIKYFNQKKFDVIDYGDKEYKINDDYPDFAVKLSKGLLKKEFDLGIILCGTGIGVCIACNKIKGIRCAKVNNAKEAKYARLDDNANIVSINGGMMAFIAKDIVDMFLKTNFSNAERHIRRLEKLAKLEDGII